MKSNIIRICTICCSNFSITTSRQKCCSKECSRINKNNINKKSHTKNKDKINVKHKEWLCTNKEHTKEYSKKYREKNKKAVIERTDNWKNKNKKYIIEYQRKIFSKKYNSDISFKLKCLVRGYVRKILRDKKVDNKTKNFITYTYEDLKLHLASLWSEGMSWENYGFYGWHIDHIKPMSSFNFINEDGSIDEEEVKKCMSLDNLQPLWMADNLSKGNKIAIIKF